MKFFATYFTYVGLSSIMVHVRLSKVFYFIKSFVAFFTFVELLSMNPFVLSKGGKIL